MHLFGPDPKSWESAFAGCQTRNITYTQPLSHTYFCEKWTNDASRLKLDPYSTSRHENLAFWFLKELPIQRDTSRPPKLQYTIQNPTKIHWTPPTQLSTSIWPSTRSVSIIRRPLQRSSVLDLLAVYPSLRPEGNSPQAWRMKHAGIRPDSL